MEPHELLELIKTRRSIRKFTSKPVPENIIRLALDAGVWAPSACNQTPVRFIVLQNKSDLRIINKVKPEIANPQAAIMAVLDLGGHYYQRWFNHPHTKQNPILDVGASMQNMALVIHAHGLASCWVSLSPYIDYQGSKAFYRRFRLPSSCRISSALFIGYPDQNIDIHRHTHHARPIDRGPMEKYLMTTPPRIVLAGAHPADFDNLGSQAMTSGMKRLIECKYPNAQYAAVEYPWKSPWKFFPTCQSLDKMPNGQLPRFLVEVGHLAQIGRLLREEREIPDAKNVKQGIKKWLKLVVGLLLKSPYKPSYPIYDPHLHDPLRTGTCPPLPLLPEGSMKNEDGWLTDTPATFSRMLSRQLPTFISKKLPGLATLLFRYQYRYVQPAYVSRLSLMSWGDIVFFDGNGVFADAYAWSGDLLLRFLAECLCAKRLGAEVYIVNQTMSVSRDWMKEIIAHVYNQMDGIVTREPLSRERLLEMGVNPQLVVCGADAATWADYTPGFWQDDGSLVASQNKYENAIALFIRGDLSEDVHMWSDIVRELARRYKRAIVYIPSSKNDDLSFAKAIAATSPLHVVESVASYRQAFFLMQKMTLVISSRYHPIYFAICAETPFVAVRGNTFKIEGLLRLLDHPLPVIASGDTYRQQILDQVEYAIKHHEQLKAQLSGYKEILKSKAEWNVDIAEKSATDSSALPV